ncbi:putative F-box protein PP2-B12 [Corylus avellana]|uniref:putative F-box protein PP2-B12 n=1 Tax=Corylus avellana TaxID=13451 RepID=UPI00286A654A|nr:putative F-box protein PP2-B12 [Corylus avellana]
MSTNTNPAQIISKKMEKRGKEKVITADVLPEDCIATIISFTSPPDACRYSVLSRTFKSAVGWDLVWERFLPPDYQQIISQSESLVSSLLNVLSKKDLYFHLCRNPVLIGNGNLSFGIDKLSGKKCYMLGARELHIVWSNTTQYWKWVSSAESPVLPQSRFSEVALLLKVCWFDIRGRIETNILSPNTTYGAYFVYTIADSFYELHHPVRVSVRLENENEGNATHAYLQPDTPEGQDGRLPRRREDRWLEIEIGEFFNGQVDSVADMHLLGTDGYIWKSGVVVHGRIELRPK